MGKLLACLALFQYLSGVFKDVGPPTFLFYVLSEVVSLSMS